MSYWYDSFHQVLTLSISVWHVLTFNKNENKTPRAVIKVENH